MDVVFLRALIDVGLRTADRRAAAPQARQEDLVEGQRTAPN
jgi:hypothetical protein